MIYPDEKIGEMIRALSDSRRTIDDAAHALKESKLAVDRCEENGARIEEKTVRMGAQLDELLHERTRGRTLLAAGRWGIGLVAGALISAAVALYASQTEASTENARQRDAIVTIRDTIDRHERRSGHEAGIADLSQLRGDVTALRATLDEVKATLRSVDDQLRRRGGRRE